jgi:hypothetical protein
VSENSAKPVVAIDSMTLVWGVRHEGDPDQLKRAKWLFGQLEQEQAQIIVPAVCVAEYLGPADPDDHAAILAAISARFIIPPFDVQCASLAARLFNAGRSGRPKGTADSRKCLRADTLIIATAITHGAKILYSGDDRCRKLAKPMMDARNLPDQPPDLFGYTE